MARVAFDATEIVQVADRLAHVAEAYDTTVGETFDAWVDSTADIMRAEIPVDQGDMRDSVTVERDGMVATIGPTNTDDKGRPIGFFVNYGAGNRAPNDFVGRTADQAREAIYGLQLPDLLP
jgi:hypothetical protein